MKGIDKKELRKKIIKRRDRLTVGQIKEKSGVIAERLYNLSAYRKAETVMFFISFGSEVDTGPMLEETIKRGKLALAPKTLPDTRELVPSQIKNLQTDLAPGVYNIPEPTAEALRPVEPEKVDLLIVPGVAFDNKGNRIGYGGGYYDRFFARLKPDTPLVALAFELQILPAVPVDDWDRRVDLIITEERIIVFNNA